MIADNDYAVGRLVEAVSHSPYWKSTAIFVLEDDAQDGPDHVDAHRSPALVISAWNRPGQLVHSVHNTVSLIRTIELLLGIAPMNQLDAAAVPMDIFRDEPDLTPYTAELPNVADDNLILSRPRSARDRSTWIRRRARTSRMRTWPIPTRSTRSSGIRSAVMSRCRSPSDGRVPTRCSRDSTKPESSRTPIRSLARGWRWRRR